MWINVQPGPQMTFHLTLLEVQFWSSTNLSGHLIFLAEKPAKNYKGFLEKYCCKPSDLIYDLFLFVCLMQTFFISSLFLM